MPPPRTVQSPTCDEAFATSLGWNCAGEARQLAFRFDDQSVTGAFQFARLRLFRCRVAGARRRLGGHRALRREVHREAAACARLAVDVEARLVARDGVLDDGQAEPRAAGFARAAAIDTVEALGQPRQVFRRDAGAGVLNREGGAVGALAPDEADLAAGRGVADG